MVLSYTQRDIATLKEAARWFGTETVDGRLLEQIASAMESGEVTLVIAREEG